MKTKIRGSWEEGLHRPCIVHHNDKTVLSSKPFLEQTPDCSESETDISYSSDEGCEDHLICREHLGVYSAIHVRRSKFLKPSTGDVEVIPMVPSSDSIEPKPKSTSCLHPPKDESAPPDIDDKPVLCSSFTWFRIYYVLVMSAIMLADGLQGKSTQYRFSCGVIDRRTCSNLAISLFSSPKGHISTYSMKDMGIPWPRSIALAL